MNRGGDAAATRIFRGDRRARLRYMEIKKPGAIVREGRGMDSDVVEELEPGAVVIAERTVVIKHKGDKPAWSDAGSRRRRGRDVDQPGVTGRAGPDRRIARDADRQTG